MKPYLDFLQHILKNGEKRADRTGTGTVSVFGYQMRFDLQQGFPLVTTKKCHLRSIIYELLWFLSGSTNVKYLRDNKVTIWDEWADADGDLGPVYGYQWRSWGKTSQNPGGSRSGRWSQTRSVDQDPSHDQITRLIHDLNTNPTSRRHIVSAWNVSDVDKMALPPCHVMFQFYVRDGGCLDCQLYQRSADSFLGVPFNIASYALLTMMVAQVTGLRPGVFVHTFGDAHIYLNHIEQVQLQLTREPRPLPQMKIHPAVKSIFEFKYEDFQLEGYDPHPAIKGEISV